jgi:hypothetical protein
VLSTPVTGAQVTRQAKADLVFENLEGYFDNARLVTPVAL